MIAMAGFIAEEIAVRCRHTLSLNCLRIGIILIISGITLQAGTQVSNITVLPERFVGAKIACHQGGKFLAALFFKEFESEGGKVKYGASLEVWELDKTMRPHRLLFQESEQSGVIYVGHLLWVGDNLLYTVLTGFPSFKEFVEYANRQVKEDPMRSARIGYYKQHYQLRLWHPGADSGKIVRIGVLGIGRDRKYFLLSSPLKDQFVLLDPEDEWDNVISKMPRSFEETRHRYVWERIIQVCKITEGKGVEVIRTLHIPGVKADPEVIGFSSEGRFLMVKAYFNPHLIKSPSFFGGPPYLLIDLMNGSVMKWKLSEEMSKFNIEFGLLSGGKLIVLKGSSGILNIKYMDLEGKLLKEYNLGEKLYEKMIGSTVAKHLKKHFGVLLPHYEAWTQDGNGLILQMGGYVWYLDIPSLTMRQIAEGVWIEKVLQWVGDKYLLIQWRPYSLSDKISQKTPVSLCFLRVK